MQLSGEPLCFPFPRHSAHAAQSLGYPFPAPCRLDAGWRIVLLGPPPSLRCLRRRFSFFVRLLHGYYTAVRLFHLVHFRRAALRLRGPVRLISRSFGGLRQAFFEPAVANKTRCANQTRLRISSLHAKAKQVADLLGRILEWLKLSVRHAQHLAGSPKRGLILPGISGNFQGVALQSKSRKGALVAVNRRNENHCAERNL